MNLYVCLRWNTIGRTIYEWEQSLEEVNIYLVPPPGITKKHLHIVISHKHLVVGIVNTAPFIDEDVGGPIKVKESTWTIADGEINITLVKMNKAETWTCALAGRDGAQEVDPVTKEELRKKMMLDRFQEEVCMCVCVIYLSVNYTVYSTPGLISLVLNLMGWYRKQGISWEV